MKTLLFIIPKVVYSFSTSLSLTFMSVLVIDIINDSKPVNVADELFPKFIQLITFKKINLDFANNKTN
jgi:hypothetical protein